MGGGWSHAPSQAKSAHRERLVLGVDLLSGERGAQEPNRVAHALVRFGEWRGVPPLHDDIGRRADPQGEPSGCEFGHGGRLHGEEPGPAGVDGHHRGPELEPVTGQRRHSERREPVGTVRLARPHVGVAELVEALVPRDVLGQRDVVKRDGDAVSIHRSEAIGSAPFVAGPRAVTLSEEGPTLGRRRGQPSSERIAVLPRGGQRQGRGELVPEGGARATGRA